MRLTPRFRACSLALFFALLSLAAGSAHACPFCTAVGPTLASRREAAQVVALGEIIESQAEAGRARVHQVLKGKERLSANDVVQLPAAGAFKPGTLLLLFGTANGDASDDQVRYEGEKISERAIAYFAHAPGLRVPPKERLAYFARYLESADPLVADDAYREFGRAPFDDVRAVADRLPMEQLRRWVGDPAVPQTRQGFYGLALGLAQTEADRRLNAEALRRLIVEPADDFRAGFDGVLGGYLILTGETGLELIEKRILANRDAAEGDVRHAITALRFYHEYGRQIPAERLTGALARLLARPEFADRAVTDLARWQAWSVLTDVARLYGQPEYDRPALRKAIVGYLLACPEPAAAVELKRLTALDPAGVAAAQRELEQLGGARQ